MDFDPLSRQAAPPRYQLESASDDDDHHHHHLPSHAAPSQPVTLHFDSSSPTGARHVVVLVAAAGKAWLESRGAPGEHASILYGQQQQASIHLPSVSDASVQVFLMPSEELPQTKLHQLAECVLDPLGAKTLVVVDSYSPVASNYHRPLGQSGEVDYETIRFLSSRFDPARISSDWRALEAPNTVTGVSAALISAATLRGLPALLVQVPDTSPQSHAQLYGSGHGARYNALARLDQASLGAIDAVVGADGTQRKAESERWSILEFARRRKSKIPSGRWGDGGMYV
ncbi:hypothetical protein ACQY0O_005608 [Thecaphora frezii]